nr:PREDICTED: LOW QUALITY PROTEIN: plexin-D1-like [Anolis carolinensis]|eukprot:XP_016851480.1 PREDICTED: LOW QUALITY PROTEIN: plexin-D1-like [Anolis carolinensis]
MLGAREREAGCSGGMGAEQVLSSASVSVSSSVYLLLLVLSAPGSGRALSVRSRFPSPTLTNNFALDASGGRLYLAAVNRLFQLSAPNLTLEAEAEEGPAEDRPLCHAPQMPQASCEHRKRPTDNYNKLLAPDPEQGLLVVCGSVYQGFCQLRRLDNVSALAVAFPAE